MTRKAAAFAISASIVMTVSCSVRDADLANYSKNENVNQILLVNCLSGSDARADFYVKSESGWNLECSGEVFIGKNGSGKEKEGDGKTPLGDFGVRTAFGVLPNPGTAIPYIDVRESTFACDEECEYYNQIIDTVGTGHVCKGEEMFTIVPEYNYGLATDYNPENIYPLGSAVFVHCKGPKTYTGGCIALDEDFMKRVLQLSDPGLRIIIR